MAIYKVLVTRDVTQSKFIFIEADSEEDAKDCASDLVDKEPGGWTQDIVAETSSIEDCIPSSPYYSPFDAPTIEMKFAPFNQPDWETYVVRPHKAGWVSARQQSMLRSDYWDYTPVGKPVVECCTDFEQGSHDCVEHYIVFPSTDRGTSRNKFEL